MTRASDTARLLGAGGTLNAALSVDTISEKTSGSGVTIDSLNVKDGGIGGGQIGGRRNIAYNGAMNVSQRSTSLTGQGAYPGGYLTVDRWKLVTNNSAGRFTVTQEAITDLPGFLNCTKLDCTTTDTSIASGEYLIFAQYLEGQDLQQIKKGTSQAEKITLSFYVKGNASATYTAEIEDSDNSRYNSQEFSVTTSWNRVVLTYNADTTGAFDDDNAASLRLNLWIHSGSDFSSGTHTSNAWHTGASQRFGDNSNSFYSSTNNTFFITGVQLEVGSQATPFEHRSFGDELALCQRYYYRINPTDTYQRYGHSMMINSTLSETTIASPVTMRSEPTFENSGTVSHYAIYIESSVKQVASDFAINAASGNDRFVIRATIASSNAGHIGTFLTNNTLLGFIAFSAEL